MIGRFFAVVALCFAVVLVRAEVPPAAYVSEVQMNADGAGANTVLAESDVVRLQGTTGTNTNDVTLSGAPVQDIWTITGQVISLDPQAANTVLAGPPSGAAAAPTMRGIVDADVPAAIARDSEVTSAVSTVNSITPTGGLLTVNGTFTVGNINTGDISAPDAVIYGDNLLLDNSINMASSEPSVGSTIIRVHPGDTGVGEKLIDLPATSGTVARVEDLSSYLPLVGGTVSGDVLITGALQSYTFLRGPGLRGATSAVDNITLNNDGKIALYSPLSLSSGGTGATTAVAARTALGLGTMAVQDAGAVNITGGTASFLSSGFALKDADGFSMFTSSGTAAGAGVISIGDVDLTNTETLLKIETGADTITARANIINLNGTVTATGLSSNYLTLTAQPTCSAWNNATQSIATGTGDTAVTFNSEDFDVGAVHSTSTNTSRFVAPSTGYYLVTFSVAWAGAGTDYRKATIKIGGSTVVYRVENRVASGGDRITSQGTTVLSLSASNYVELYVQQASGGAINIGDAGSDLRTRFTMTKLF